MIEVTETLRIGDESPTIEDVKFTYSRPEQTWLNRNLIRLIERLSGQPKLERLYREWSRNPPPDENIFTAGLRLMEISIDTDYTAWQAVPKEGPVIFVANHPFGVVDGLIMGHLATRVRPDTKLMTHSLLCQPPEARDYMLPVDFGGTPEAQQTSLLTRRRTTDWLNSGHAVAIFPAGSVATAQSPLWGPALDPAWHPFVGKLARMPGVTVVPICFHGGNSRLFHLMSHVHYALRIALLFHETIRRTKTTVKVSIGSPIGPRELCSYSSREEVLKFIRMRTISLAGAEAPPPLQEFQWPSYISFN